MVDPLRETLQHTGSFEQAIGDLALEEGATAVGIASVTRLPKVPSADPAYLLPGARSLVSVMVPYDDEIVRRFLGKQDRDSMQRHETALYRRLDRVARAVAGKLRTAGHEAIAAAPNLDYRYKRRRAYRAVPHALKQQVVDWLASDAHPVIQRAKQSLVPPLYRRLLRVASWRLTPTFSHRYGAVAAGLGVIGWSGNVLHPEYGARVLFNTVLTSAALRSDNMLDDMLDDMLDEPVPLCDGCRLCARSCQSGYIHTKAKDQIEIGGHTYSHNRKANNLRCILVCGGFTGQSRYPKWSTWSAGRVTVPEDDAELQRCWDELIETNLTGRNHASKTLADLIYHSEYGFVRKPEDRFQTTCGYCQFVCAPERDHRRELHRLLSSSSSAPERANPE